MTLYAFLVAKEYLKRNRAKTLIEAFYEFSRLTRKNENPDPNYLEKEEFEVFLTSDSHAFVNKINKKVEENKRKDPLFPLEDLEVFIIYPNLPSYGNDGSSIIGRTVLTQTTNAMLREKTSVVKVIDPHVYHNLTYFFMQEEANDKFIKEALKIDANVAPNRKNALLLLRKLF